MKRITVIIAAVVVMGVLSVSCNNYVCPAYTQETADQEQSEDLNS
jgi:hypothetical protein